MKCVITETNFQNNVSRQPTCAVYSVSWSSFQNKQKMSKLKLLVSSSGGLVAGYFIHKYGSNNSISSTIESLPGCPKFGTVSAASVAVMSPPTTSSLPMPIPELNKNEIPPEPQKGISRVAEIMRFGFPGFDNIRSRKWVKYVSWKWRSILTGNAGNISFLGDT